MKTLKYSALAVLPALLGWAGAFLFSAVLIKMPSIKFWIGETCVGCLILLIGFFVNSLKN